MTTKITLITPPDIYQNNNDSILFIDITDDEQDAVSKWLAQSENHLDFNIYFYQGEPNIVWLLHSLSCSSFKYINLNNISTISSYMAGYILSKAGVFYRTEDDNVAELYSHINLNRVKNSDEFLEKIINGKK
jgi:hypothetical protein